jgi:hypothetical protein
VLLGERTPSAPIIRRDVTDVSPFGRGGMVSPAVKVYLKNTIILGQLLVLQS